MKLHEKEKICTFASDLYYNKLYVMTRFLFFLLLLFAINTAKATDNTEKTDFMPRITGMLNVRYQYDESDKDHQGFDLRRVRLGLKGNLHKKLDYVFQAEYAGNVRIIDSYLRWKIRPEFNIQAGEFKVHYSMETFGGPADWLTTEIATAVNKLNGYSDLSGLASHKNGRDIGLMIYGAAVHKEDFDVLRYRLGVFNGNGINVKDDNRKKDVAAMLWVNPLRQLTFTGSYYCGSYGPHGADHVRNRASAGVEWKDSKLMVRSEYLWGHTSNTRQNGVYGQIGYRVHQFVQPVVQYDYMKFDNDQNGVKAPYQHNLQIGLNVEPIDHFRIQAGYMHSIENNDQHNNLVTLQCCLTL